MIDFTFVARAIQLVFALIVLGLTAYVTSNFDDAPGEINFMLFTAIWTLLIVPFLMFAQKFFPKLAHPFVTLALEFLTMLFWFAAFISVAVWVDDFFCAGNDVCGSSKAAAAFGAFIWALFAYTFAMTFLTFWKGRNSTGSTNPEMQQGV